MVMIFTQEAPLTRKWFSGRSCIRSKWNLRVNFEEGGNRSARRKPSKSGWDRPKLNPHTTFVVEVEGVIDVHYASLTSQRVQHRVFYLDGHPSRYQPRPTGLNFGEQTGTGVFPLVIFPLGDSRTSQNANGFESERQNDRQGRNIQPCFRRYIKKKENTTWISHLLCRVCLADHKRTRQCSRALLTRRYIRDSSLGSMMTKEGQG